MTDLLRQSVRFGLVGLVNTVIGLAAIYALMYFVGVGPALANALGYAIGLAVGFALNRSWTFKSKQSAVHLLPRYLNVAAASYLLNLCVVMAATSQFAVNAYLAQLMGIGIYTISMFLGCRRFVFETRRAA